MIKKELFSMEKVWRSESELIGIWYYMSARLYSCLSNKVVFPFEPDFVNKVQSLILDKVSKHEWGKKTNTMLLQKMIRPVSISCEESCFNKPLGLNGLAGYILNSIS